MSEAGKLHKILPELSSPTNLGEQVILKDAFFIDDENNLDISERSHYPADEQAQDARENMPSDHSPLSLQLIENQVDSDTEYDVELRIWDTLTEEDLVKLSVKPKFWLRFFALNSLTILIGLGLGVFTATLILDGNFDSLYHAIMALRNKIF